MRTLGSARYAVFSDDALLEAVLRRDARAFAELLGRFRGLLFRCISRVTARYTRVLSSEDLDEIFAEACAALWTEDLRRLRAFDPNRGMKLGSWLGLIATHAAYDFLRRVARRPHTDDLDAMPEPAAPTESALDQLLADERRGQLGALTRELSGRDREFFRAYFAEDRDAEDVARALGISVKTVYSKKNKITARLLEQAEALRAA